MTSTTILVSTWSDGVFAFTGETCQHEFAGQSVRALALDRHGDAVAIVDELSVCRRAASGAWSTIATSEFRLACAVSVGDVLYVGTDDARVLRVRASGAVDQLGSFDDVPGRNCWYAGGTLIDGRFVGPPLGVRSITATSNGDVLLANVHVGGIVRSTDGGRTWQPTIAVDNDVHEVLAHPADPDLVIAAAATGFCVSRDSGASWTVETDGLHATHCTAVAFWGNDILVSAATQHFATEGAVYRRPVNGLGPLAPVADGLPRWIDGIVDTGCMRVRAATAAMADRCGNLYVSANAERTWSRRATGLSAPSSVLVV